MTEQNWLAERFEQNRSRLRAVAYRMLGSATEADDAVQESWLRLSRADTSGLENLSGWLTTVVARVCLDMLRSRKSRREETLEVDTHATIANRNGGVVTPEQEALFAESVSRAMLVVLETLAPAERVAFVLHDMFAMPFDEIAPIVGRTSDAARQLASRARRRVQGGSVDIEADRTRQREVVEAFLAASRSGDLTALLAVLDPEIVLRADHAAVRASEASQASGAPKLAPEVRGANLVAEVFSGRAKVAQTALVDGNVGAIIAPGGTLRAIFDFTIVHGKIAAIEIVSAPERLRELDVVVLNQ